MILFFSDPRIRGAERLMHQEHALARQGQGGKMVLHVTHSTHTSVGCVDRGAEVLLARKIKEDNLEAFLELSSDFSVAKSV